MAVAVGGKDGSGGGVGGKDPSFVISVELRG